MCYMAGFCVDNCSQCPWGSAAEEGDCDAVDEDAPISSEAVVETPEPTNSEAEAAERKETSVWAWLLTAALVVSVVPLVTSRPRRF